MDDKVYEQVANVAALPGIVNASYAMPDAHWGYGFPIGGVAAFDPDDGGVVSAGGVGFDISCGVRTLLTGRHARADRAPVKRRWPTALYRAHSRPESAAPARCASRRPKMDAMLEGGARWAVERGYGAAAKTSTGSKSMARWRAPSRRASRMRRSGGSATRWERSARATTISKCSTWPRSSTAPRPTRSGFATGDMVDQHPLRLARPRPPDRHRVPARDGDHARKPQASTLPDRELACAPIRSAVGQRYLGAMRAAINCALANRQILTHLTRNIRGCRVAATRSSRCSTTCRTTRARSRITSSTAGCGDSSSIARVRRARSVRAIRICRPALRRSRAAGADRRQHGHGVVHPRRHAREPGRGRSLPPVTAPAAA